MTDETKVKRYDMSVGYPQYASDSCPYDGRVIDTDESANGDWVHYEDYLQLEQRIALYEAVVTVAKRFDDCLSEFDGDLKYCGELLDNLFDAVSNLKKFEAEK